MSAFGKIVDVIAALLIMFILPFFFVLEKQDFLVQQFAQQKIFEFTDTLSDFGFIDEQVYEKLVDDLAAAGTAYELTICHRQKVYEPEYEANAFTGRVMVYESETYEKEIIRAINERGAYYFDIGDEVRVEIEIGGVSFSSSRIIKGMGQV